MSMPLNPTSQSFVTASLLESSTRFLADRWAVFKAGLARAPAPREPRTPEELIEWAARYEKTQPSYAADLRAAAWRAQEQARRG